MTIAAILEAKGGNVLTVDVQTTVREAVALLAERKIGAIPVIGEGKVLGVMSERDVIYGLCSEGAALLDKPVSHVMSAPAITIDRTVGVLTALSQMTKRRIRHLPVVESDEIIGIVSIGDLVAHRIRNIEQEAEAMRNYIQSA